MSDLQSWINFTSIKVSELWLTFTVVMGTLLIQLYQYIIVGNPNQKNIYLNATKLYLNNLTSWQS